MVQSTINNQIVDAVYRRMRSRIFAIFRQARIPEGECEDLVQDVFAKLLQLDVIREETASGITATIAFHMRTDYLRRRAVIRNAHRYMQTADMFDSDRPDNGLFVSEIYQLETHVLERMSQRNRDIYLLSRYEEKSNEEIAKIMNMSYRAVESRLFRARSMVRNHIRRMAL